MTRLKPYKDKDPHAGWDKWVCIKTFDQSPLYTSLM